MKVIKKIFGFILNPVGSFYSPKTTEQVVKKTNKSDWFIYVIALLITALIILYSYKEVIFK